MSGKSRADLIEFLNYLEDKSLMPHHTVQARRAAVKKVLGVLGDDEAADITEINLETVARQFENRHGRDFRPDSLQTYVSRVRSTIADFERYLENPSGFKPTARTVRRKPNDSGRSPSPKEGSSAQERSQQHGQEHSPSDSGTTFSISLRENVVVHIRGLPADLTEAEAKKIANVITALGS